MSDQTDLGRSTTPCATCAAVARHPHLRCDDHPFSGRRLSCGCTGSCPHSEYPEPSYLCNCGQSFPSHLARVVHAATCPVMKSARVTSLDGGAADA